MSSFTMNKKNKRAALGAFMFFLLSFVMLVAYAGALTNASAKASTNTAISVKPESFTDIYPWSAMFFVGRTAKEPIGRVLKGKFTSTNETLYTGEIAYTLARSNPIRRFFSLLVSEVQLAGNFTIRDGKYNKGTVYEFNPYIVFRWTHFPWNRFVDTTLAAAEGVSYDTKVIWSERRYNSDCSRFLNYLMFEITFAAPSYPRLQFLIRMHHRSGGYGLYGAGNTGSNAVGAGIRYYF